MSSSQDDIDQLLERYLALLDEYSKLRKELSQLQADVYHDIARANFSGERGLRYGQDQYDERMRASRRVGIAVTENGLPGFTVTTTTCKEPPPIAETGRGVQEKQAAENAYGAADNDEPVESPDAEGAEEAKDERGQAGGTKIDDPLRWFGILTPMPLRAAQRHAIRAVEDVVPRLASVNAEMRHVEVEVRRARKRRAKAEAARGKARDREASTTLGRDGHVRAA
ncbi:uncharacterized protein MAM_01586 [Metarhizium album ARSEF 1941]|uniref:Vacuolar ATPase assembly protein VMA22 n=1 Tax=Metarhizium album (strain ARSEF 1941) TaxID=1081103 RepID=A0A0B2X505_METAS|nr:uncharacterized protein MAM_01586 [Metarhizium album ARSEF 1941]KHO00808.1 hypothetical protein MAM_01586 [Metarhizium album ARSEF 1941]